MTGGVARGAEPGGPRSGCEGLVVLRLEDGQAERVRSRGTWEGGERGHQLQRGDWGRHQQLLFGWEGGGRQRVSVWSWLDSGFRQRPSSSCHVTGA